MKRNRLTLAAIAIGTIVAVTSGPVAADARAPDPGYRQVHDRHVERGRDHRDARRHVRRHGPVLRHRYGHRPVWRHWQYRHRHVHRAWRPPYIFHFRF